MTSPFRRVVVGKIDLDTIGAAWLLGVSSADEIQVVRGAASSEDLANPDVVCIEVGGSGQVEMNNFDHHGEGSEDLLSATKQVFLSIPFAQKYEWWRGVFAPRWIPRWEQAEELVEYIDILDRQGPEEIRRLSSGEPPYLSDIISGILLTKRDPKEQMLEGIRVLQLLNRGDFLCGPFGTMFFFIERYGLQEYVEAKAENDRFIAKALEKANWGSTRSGLKMAWLETSFPGALGALYNNGAQVVVAFNPDFNGVRKFTVGGNDVRVNSIQPLVDEAEEGWGGPGTGTILGSPMSGSVMELDEVVRIVQDNL